MELVKMNLVDIRTFLNTPFVYDLAKFAPKVTPVFMDRDTLVYKVFFFSFCPSQQNQKLKQELLESHTNIAFLQSELDSLKSDLTDQSINLEQ